MDEGRPLTPESLMPRARFIKNQEICPRTGTQKLGHDEGNPAQRTSRCDHGSLAHTYQKLHIKQQQRCFHTEPRSTVRISNYGTIGYETDGVRMLHMQ